MKIKQLNNLSLNALLITTVIMTVVMTITIYTAFICNNTKKKRFAEIKEHSQLIVDVTHQVIGRLIASYNVNEYEQVLIGEMGRGDILAIIINDNNMGKILGKDTFVNGKIRNGEWEIIDFDSQSSVQKELLKTSCHVVKSDIVYNGNLLGTVEVYGADRFMNIELDEIIQQSMINGVIIALFLITTLLVSIRFIVIDPLHKMIHAISNTDSGGIPLNDIPVAGPSEISSLTITMNNMIGMIRQSRVKLQAHQEDLERIVAQRTRELVREKKNADRANKAKSEFLAGMSHELRTPLNAIIGFSRRMMNKSDLSPEYQKNLEIIHTRGDHLLSLINRMIEISKIEDAPAAVDRIDSVLKELQSGDEFNKPVVLEELCADNIVSGFTVLPAGLTDDFEQAIHNVNVEQMHGLIEQIRGQEPELADILENYVNEFEYEEILSLIQSGRRCRNE